MIHKHLLLVLASHAAHSLWEYYLGRTRRFVASSTIELISGAGSLIMRAIRKPKK